MARSFNTGAQLRRALLGGVALGALGLSGAASAQGIWPQGELVGQSPFNLGTIFINARRVEESLDEAPIAVSVQTEEDLGTGRIDGLGDLARTAPNVFAFNSNGLSFVVRGVGSQSVQGLNSEVGVGLFLDEVYMGRPDLAPVYLDDLEQTEIVRGSQSTIYGRNTIGGAVNLVSRQPGEVLGGEVELSYGSDGYYRVRGAADIPLSEDGNWLSRTYLSFTHRPDGITNLATGEDDLAVEAASGRFAVSGQLGDFTSLYFSLDFESFDDNGQGGWSPLPMALAHQSDLDFPAHHETDRGGAMLRIEHDFDAFWFQSITAYRGFDQDLALDGDFGSGPYDPMVGAFALQQGRIQEQRQFTQEFRIGSHDSGEAFAGDLSWHAGLFFMSENFEGREYYELASIPVSMASSNILEAEAQAYSVFANMSYQVTDRFALHGGIRFSQEERSGDVSIISPAGTFIYGFPQAGSAEASDFNISPELGFDYQLSDSTLIFGRVSTGYKSGGIAQFFDAGGNVNTYDPETSLTFEAGLRTRLWDDRVALDVTVFHTDWTDQQTNVFISDVQRVTANAASAVSRGVEIGLDAQLSDELRLRASYGYLDAEFEDFRYTYFSAGAGANVTLDYSGNPIPLAPEHSLSLSFDWERPVGNGLTLAANGVYTYQSSYTFDPVAVYEQPETHLLDASIALQGDNWEARLWATNLLDEEYLTNYFLFGTTNFGIAAPGRTVGLTLSQRW